MGRLSVIMLHDLSVIMLHDLCVTVYVCSEGNALFHIKKKSHMVKCYFFLSVFTALNRTKSKENLTLHHMGKNFNS